MREIVSVTTVVVQSAISDRMAEIAIFTPLKDSANYYERVVEQRLLEQPNYAWFGQQPKPTISNVDEPIEN